MRAATAADQPVITMPLPYTVHTTAGLFQLVAISAAQAVATALELAGPGASVLMVCRDGEW